MTDNQDQEKKTDNINFEREPITDCAYCGESFENELERGIHQADEHVDSDERYETKKKRQHNPYINIVDEWKEDSEPAQGGLV